MNISKQYKEIIVEELKSIAKKMTETSDITEKIYFFSATYSIMNRIFNLEFSPTLVLIHMVLQNAYLSISERVNASITGRDKAVKIPSGLFDVLQEKILDLAEIINKDNKNELFINLQEIANISYSTTGNGYYLFQKGMLKI
jgi:hypothetical protein